MKIEDSPFLGFLNLFMFYFFQLFIVTLRWWKKLKNVSLIWKRRVWFLQPYVIMRFPIPSQSLFKGSYFFIFFFSFLLYCVVNGYNFFLKIKFWFSLFESTEISFFNTPTLLKTLLTLFVCLENLGKETKRKFCILGIVFLLSI